MKFLSTFKKNNVQILTYSGREIENKITFQHGLTLRKYDEYTYNKILQGVF